MMFRFSLLLGLLAGPAVAEQVLDRAEIKAMLASHALCYRLNAGSCLSGEVYSAFSDDGADVYTGFPFFGRTLVLHETLYWEGDTLCQTQDASGFVGAWRQPDEAVFEFTQSEDTRLGAAFVSSQRDQLSSARTAPYCFGFVQDDNGLRPYSPNRSLDGVSVDLVPFSQGRLRFD